MENEPKKRGRKTKLTPELQKKLCDVLSTGNYIEAACDYVGIDDSQFYRWLESNCDFRDAVKKARSSAELQSVARIRKAGQGGDIASVTEITHLDGTNEKNTKYTTAQWQADAWYLERSYPNRWGRRVQEIQGKIEHEHSIDPGAINSIRSIFRTGTDSSITLALGEGRED